MPKHSLEDFDMKNTEYINVKYLSVDPLTRRGVYDPKIQKMLEEDIAEHGFRKEHPLTVRPDKKKRNRWVITCGQHRFEAGVKVGICNFPCVKKEFQDDIHAIAEAYKDNTLACPVDAITEAEYFKKLGLRLLKERGHSINSVRMLKRKYPEELIALQMGVKTAFVKHRLALLNLPKFVKWLVRRSSMPSEKGLKLYPTVAEEVGRIYRNILNQRKAGTTKVNAKSAIAKLALKFSREKTTLHDARKIGADMAYKGYDAWANQKPIPENTIRCAKCGEKIEPEDSPWLALCPKHKEKYLNRSLKPNPHLIPLHESSPHQHKVKDVDALNEANIIYSNRNAGLRTLTSLTKHPLQRRLSSNFVPDKAKHRGC